jgi:hypothetical protein
MKKIGTVCIFVSLRDEGGEVGEGIGAVGVGCHRCESPHRPRQRPVEHARSRAKKCRSQIRTRQIPNQKFVTS